MVGNVEDLDFSAWNLQVSLREVFLEILLLPYYFLVDHETRAAIRIKIQKNRNPKKSKTKHFDVNDIIEKKNIMITRSNIVKNMANYVEPMKIEMVCGSNFKVSFLNPGISICATNYRISNRLSAMVEDLEIDDFELINTNIRNSKDCFWPNWWLILNILIGKILRRVFFKKNSWHLQYSYKNSKWKNVKLTTNAADPFLFEVDGQLTCLYESFTKSNRKGEISRFSFSSVYDLESRISGDVAFSSDTHLSFPCTLTLGEEIYVCPENSQAGKLTLYKIVDSVWESWIEIKGNYVDPLIIENQSGLFLLAARKMRYDSLGSYKVERFKINLNHRTSELDQVFSIWHDDLARPAGKIGDKIVFQGFHSGVYGAFIKAVGHKDLFQQNCESNIQSFDLPFFSKVHHFFEIGDWRFRDISRF